MRTSHKVGALLVLVSALAIGVVLAIRPGAETLIYRGKSVKDWALAATANDPAAMESLKTMGPRAVPGLMRLLQYRDSWLRKKAWQWQWRLPLQGAQWMAQHVRWPDAYHYREAGARGLGLIGPGAKDAVPLLGRALADHEGRVNWEAATALAHIGAPSVAVLTKALRDPSTRHAAAFAFGEMGPAAAPAASALGKCLSDTNELVRSSALYSLSMIGAPALPVLMEARDHGPTNLQDAVSAALDRLYPALRAEPGVLLNLASSDDAATRTTALQTIGMIRAWTPEAVATLIGGLKDPATEVRLAAAQSLGRISRKAFAAVPALTSALEDPSAEVRQAAARTLGRMGPPAASALPQLKKLTGDADASVRTAAQQAVTAIEH